MKSSKYIRSKKSGFTDFVNEILKKNKKKNMSASDNLKTKGTILTLGEDELLA